MESFPNTFYATALLIAAWATAQSLLELQRESINDLSFGVTHVVAHALTSQRALG